MEIKFRLRKTHEYIKDKNGNLHMDLKNFKGRFIEREQLGKIVGYEWIDENNRWNHKWESELDGLTYEGYNACNCAFQREQFTGKKDREGNEIYFGDILKTRTGKYFEIKEGEFGDETGDYVTGFILPDDYWYWEICGNIYQN